MCFVSGTCCPLYRYHCDCHLHLWCQGHLYSVGCQCGGHEASGRAGREGSAGASWGEPGRSARVQPGLFASADGTGVARRAVGSR